MALFTIVLNVFLILCAARCVRCLVSWWRWLAGSGYGSGYGRANFFFKFFD